MLPVFLLSPADVTSGKIRRMKGKSNEDIVFLNIEQKLGEKQSALEGEALQSFKTDKKLLEIANGDLPETIRNNYLVIWNQGKKSRGSSSVRRES